MSNIKPILFNTDMVQAILEGRKTVTRRTIKKYIEMCDIDVDGTIIGLPDMYGDFHRIEEFAPYQKGDILYVRETWWEDRFYRFRGKENPQYYYRADGETITIGREVFLAPKWKPSIHMPKEAARIFLRVTNVSVAKLQDITEEQAKAEGAEANNVLDAVHEFRIIWDDTLKGEKALIQYGWFANPWVWVIEFEKKEHKNEQ